MSYFLKLNVVSMMFALVMFVPAELLINVYRLNRLTGLDFGVIEIATLLINVIILVSVSWLIVRLNSRWLGIRKANYWTILLWFPYFILFTMLFSYFFPITNRGDAPNPVTGLMLLMGFICMPIYILILNFFCHFLSEEEV